MGQSYFIWKGKDCRSMGVWLQGPVAIVRPEERVEHVQIVGRSGDLTETEGEDIYNSYIQTATILVKGGYRVREVYSWLRGSGYVTFSGEPDRRQKARIIGAVTLNKHAYNIDWWVGEVQFYCQPLKELLVQRSATVTPTGVNSSIANFGDVTARPLLKVNCTGDGSGGRRDVVITINERTFTVEKCSATDKPVIDADTMIVTNEDGTEDWTSWSSGEFPVLDVGPNNFSGSGWSSISVVDRRERFL